MPHRRSLLIALVLAALMAVVPAGLTLSVRAQESPPESAQKSAQESIQESTEEVSTPAPTTVILVRHAEKARTPQDDPVLNMAGQARAGRLVRLVEKAGVTALYATDRQRTQQTLQPLAASLGLEIGTVAADDTTGMARAALSHPGGVVVIAAHSNTLGPIIEALGAPTIEPIPETEYDNVFVVTVCGEGKATVLRLWF